MKPLKAFATVAALTIALLVPAQATTGIASAEEAPSVVTTEASGGRLSK